MKNRRIVLIAFMLAAVLTMGIGFAAYSTTLSVNGTTAVSADALQFTDAVQFVHATTSNEAFGTATASGDTASFEVTGMTAYNDHVEFVYTIANGSEYDVAIEISTRPTAADPNFTVTTSLSANAIPSGGTITATVNVVLNQNVTAPVDPVAWTIKYTAVSVEP